MAMQRVASVPFGRGLHRRSRGASAALALTLASVLALSLGAHPAAAQAPGWMTFDLGGGRYARRYLPASVRTCDPLPLVMFLHGAGGTPEAYEPQLEAHAESLGLVLLLPAASGAGWSDADTPTLNGALDAIDAELLLDGTRTYVAGHSAGAAWAYILGYGSPGIAAIFSMSAPFYAVGGVADPSYVPPIHMYYGADDPNYTGGSAAALEAQWTRLGATYETDVQVGFGHSTWPPSSVLAGLTFLLAHRAPGAPPASTCGVVDAGTSGGDAGGIDAGAPLDAGATDAARADAGVGPGTDAGPRVGRARATGCGCRTSGGAPPATAAFDVVAGLLLIVFFGRGRRSARRRERSA